MQGIDAMQAWTTRSLRAKQHEVLNKIPKIRKIMADFSEIDKKVCYNLPIEKEEVIVW